MNVMAWPGMIRIKRGVIPFHKASGPSSLAIKAHDWPSPVYYRIKKGNNVSEQDNKMHSPLIRAAWRINIPLAFFQGGRLAFAFSSWPRLCVTVSRAIMKWVSCNGRQQSPNHTTHLAIRNVPSGLLTSGPMPPLKPPIKRDCHGKSESVPW